MLFFLHFVIKLCSCLVKKYPFHFPNWVQLNHCIQCQNTAALYSNGHYFVCHCVCKSPVRKIFFLAQSFVIQLICNNVHWTNLQMTNKMANNVRPSLNRCVCMCVCVYVTFIAVFHHFKIIVLPSTFDGCKMVAQNRCHFHRIFSIRAKFHLAFSFIRNSLHFIATNQSWVVFPVMILLKFQFSKFEKPKTL